MKSTRHFLLWPLLCSVIYQFYILYNLDDEQLPTIEDLVEKHGYSLETYDVETEDGYILGVHRVGRKGVGHLNRSVVLLQHGMASSSEIFVSAGPNTSLAFLLADRGYDVWLGNSRGNSHSRRHRTLDIDSSEYWDFSYDEMGYHDLKVMVDKALEVSGQERLHYVGFSLGNHLLLVLLTTRPEYSQKISQGIMLAPAIYSRQNRFPPGFCFAQYYAKWHVKLWHSNWLPKLDICSKLIFKLCSPDNPMSILCYLGYLTFGPSSQVQESVMPVTLSTSLSSTSMKTFAHLALNYDTEKFERMDPDTNQQTVYDLNLVTTPMALVYSKNDYLSIPLNVKKLHSELNNSTIHSFEGFNHLDFLFGKHVANLVYKKVIRLIERNSKY